jgi:ribosomal protein L37AE/L43A
MQLSRKQKRTSEAANILLNPVLCASGLLRSSLWLKQQEILLSVNTHLKTAVKACHASGKTYVAAVAVLWWLITHRNCIVLTTAPTWMQVERVLWSEIHAAVNRAAYVFPRPSATKLELEPNRYAIGLSTNESVRFQGFHAENILVIIDEAPGVLPEIYDAIAGITAGGNIRILALGNPVIASGPFYDAFTEKRESWNLITISAFDTPNLAGLTPESLLGLPDHELDANSYPYLTTRRWVQEKYKEWGPGHPLWESRVLGNFPTQSEDALFALTWLEQAKLRTEGDGDLYAGIDVAGPGEDETVLCVRRGPRIILLRIWANRDPRGDVLAALLPYKGSLKGVNIDSAGIGYYMAQHLKDHELPVTEINVGERAKDSEKFFNRKAEVYWAFRMRAEAGDVAGLTDERAIAQLVGIRYSHNSRGQVVIESKEDARKRGVKSPDRAEAIILAFAELAPRYGLIEYFRQEAEKIAAQKEVPSAPAACPNCGNAHLSLYGEAWKCNLCGAAGRIGEEPVPQCPNCGSTAVVRIGSERRCNQCGVQFGDKPPNPNPYSRGEALQAADAHGVFGWRR